MTLTSTEGEELGLELTSGVFVFFVVGLSNRVDVRAEAMAVLLHGHFHQAGAWRDESTTYGQM